MSHPINQDPNYPSAILFVKPPQFAMKFRNSVLEQYGCQTILVNDSDADSNAQDCYDAVFTADLFSRDLLHLIFNQIAAAYRVKMVVGFSETSVLAAAWLANAFGVKGIGMDVAMRCRDKYQMMNSLNTSSVNVPAYFLADSAGELENSVREIGGFPVICKPLMGFASAGVIKTHNLNELNSAIRRIKRINRFMLSKYYGFSESKAISQILVQTYIKGDEVAVDGYVQNGQSTVLSVLDKPDVSNGPYFDDRMHIMPSRLTPKVKDEIARIAQACVHAIELNDSPFHIEARIENDRIYILEIAARVGFVRCLYNSTGIDLLDIMLALKMGKTPDITHKWHKYSGTFCVTTEQLKRFDRVNNHDELLNDPAIVDILLFAQPGQRIVPPPEGNNYVAFIHAIADSYEQVKQSLECAVTKLEIIGR